MGSVIRKSLKVPGIYLILLIIFLSVLNSCKRPEVKDLDEENKRQKLAVLLDYSADEISRFPKNLLIDLKKADSIAINLQDSNAMCLINLGKSHCFGRVEQFDSSLFYAMKALKLAEAIKNDTLLAKANNVAGNLYCALNDFVTASKYYSKALDIAESIQDSTGKATMINNFGLIYANIGDYEKAIKCYNEAISIYNSIGDDYRKAMAYGNLIPIYNQSKDSLIIMDCYSKAYSIFRNSNDTLAYSKLMLNIVPFYEQTGKIDSAVQIMYSVLKNARSMNQKEIYSLALNNLGIVYFLYLDDPEKGKQFIDSSLQLTREMSNTYLQMENLNILSGIEIESGNYKQGYEYYCEYIELKDSIVGGDVKKAIITNDLQNKIDKREYEAKLLQQKFALKSKQNLILYISICSILVFAIMLGLVIRASYRNLKKSNTINELENQRLEEQLELDRKVNEVEKLKLDAELNAKNKELVSYSLKLVTKNDLLDNISKIADKYYNNNDLNRLFYNDLTRVIEDNLNIDKEWNQFKSMFEKVHHDFFNRLKQDFPNLTENELRFCAYCKINLRTKEIARMLNVNPETVRKTKYRLKLKLDLDKDSYLEDFLRLR